jgi:hypothetical protein
MPRTTRAQETREQEAQLFELELVTIDIPVISVSPFLAHRFSEEAQQAIAAAQQGAHRTKKPPRDPEREFELCQYRLPDGRHGIPAAAFKRAVVRACPYVSGLPMTVAEGALQIPGTILPFTDHTEPVMQADRVVIGRKITSVAYRARYDHWELTVPVRFQANVISPERLVNLFEIAGFAVGVGDWRPQCHGSFGMFEVKKD